MPKYAIITQGRDIRSVNNIRRYNFTSLAAAVRMYTELCSVPNLHKVEFLAILEMTEVQR